MDSLSGSSAWSAWIERVSRGYVGKRDPVVRRLKLALDVPVLRITPRGRRLQESLAATLRSWNDLDNHPLPLLRKIEHCLQGVNSEHIPARLHLAVVERALHHAVPAIRKIYLAEYKSEAVPESHDRREGLTVAANVCQQLGTGYKHQLMQDFALSDKAYERVRQRVRAHALRVFELMRVEQRLRAMRYQKLSRMSWMDCHRLFITLAESEDLHGTGPALNCLKPAVDGEAGVLLRRAGIMTSIHNAYLTINLFGLIDINALSSPKMHVADRQLSRALGKLRIAPDHGEPLAEGEVIIYYGQDGPGHFQRADEKAVTPPLLPEAPKPFWKRALAQSRSERGEGPIEPPPVAAVKIDFSPLTNMLANERHQLTQRFAAEQAAASGAIVDKQDLARLLVLDIMYDRLRFKQRENARQYISEPEVLLMHNGFMAAYQLLSSLAAGQALSPQSLQMALAGQSALISLNEDAYHSRQWVVLDKNDQAVHIKTQESPFTHAMFIGQLLAFSFSSASAEEPWLGYVVRISRSTVAASGAHDIEVTLRILSRKPSATLIQNTFLSENDMAMPAILLADGATERLVLHHSHRLKAETQVQIDAAGQLRKVTLSGIAQLAGEFVVYSLTDGHVTH